MQGGNPFGGNNPYMSFDDDNKFIIQGDRRRSKKVDPNSPTVEREGGVFHEKLGSIIGPSYIGGKHSLSFKIDFVQ